MVKKPDPHQIFHDRLAERFSREYTSQTMSDWISTNTTIRGLPFSYKGYEFQRAIADDMHPNMDVKKCSQVGLTEVEIRKSLGFLSRNSGTALIFTLPEEKLYRKIAQTRILPLVNKDKIFNLEQDADSVRSMSIIQVGSSWLYVTACTEGDATSTAADAVMNDEVDLSPQDMLGLFNSRMQNSAWRMNQRFSTPSFPAYGIDAGYNSSDQRRYLLKCSCCNHWNWPQFNEKFCHLPGLPEHIGSLFEIDDDARDKIDMANAYIMCEECHAPLDPDGPREWIATFPNRTHARGYWVTPFSTTRLGLEYLVDQLLKYKKRDYLRGFYNTVLGETYSDSNTQITLESIEAAFQPGSAIDLPRDKPLSIGIDMGQTCHIVIGDDTGNIIYAFISIPADDLVDYVEKLFKNHRIVAGACDRVPYTPTANQLRDKTNGVIMPIHYNPSGKGVSKLVEDEYEKIDYALMNRTKMLDEVSKSFRLGQMQLYGYGHQKQVITEHYRDMVRDEKPEVPATWKKLTGNDHYFHATGYMKVGIQLRPMVIAHDQIEIRTMFGLSFAQIGKPKDDPGLAGFTRIPSKTLVA